MKKLRADLSQGMFASIQWTVFPLLVRYKKHKNQDIHNYYFCLLLSMGVKLGRWQ